MIERWTHVAALESRLRQFPVVAILGARQVGKTTLARQLVWRRRGPTTTFDLESAEDLALLADPLLSLRPLQGLIVIDEVQRRPDLFATLRVLSDEPGGKRRFLVLGSASPDLLRQSSESLAGRISYHELRTVRAVNRPCGEAIGRAGEGNQGAGVRASADGSEAAPLRGITDRKAASGRPATAVHLAPGSTDRRCMSGS